MLNSGSLKTLVLLVATVMLSACAAQNYKPPAVTAKGAKVKVVDKQPRRCAYLGELTGYNMRFEWSHDIYNMREKMQVAFDNTLRNTVADMGGNTAVLLFRNHDAGMYTYLYSVQKCKS